MDVSSKLTDWTGVASNLVAAEAPSTLTINAVSGLQFFRVHRFP